MHTQEEREALGVEICDKHADVAFDAFMEGYAQGFSAREMATFLYSRGWVQGILDTRRYEKENSA